MCQSLTIFLSSAPIACTHQRKHSIFLGLKWTLWPATFSCYKHVFVFRRVALDSTLNGYIISLFSCCPTPLPYLQFISPFSSIPSSSHLFCFCICDGNNSDGRRNLPADLLIIHHSLFVRLYAVGESAVPWVSEGETAPWLWGWLRGHLWSSGKRTAVQLLACCQASYLLACLPPLTWARCGWNANESSEGIVIGAHFEMPLATRPPMLIANILKKPFLTLVEGRIELWQRMIAICSQQRCTIAVAMLLLHLSVHHDRKPNLASR